jgi:beta-barrel assembly-enhancing protease
VKTTGTTPWRSRLLTVLMLAALSVASSSHDKKKPKAYRDINAIGHRVIDFQSGLGNWYSLDKEKEIGAQLSAEYEKSTSLIHDEATQTYLDRLAQTISRTRVVDSGDSFALTLAGGYQYISRGLLLQTDNEGELAAAIARGIAHTSLRSATGLATRASLMEAMTVPVIFGVNSTSGQDFSVPLTQIKFIRGDESAADYFGVQYLYKSGYAPECFVSFVQKVWPPQTQPTANAFSPFPLLPERLEALRKEISEILPKQNSAVTNTENFLAFREHLLSLAPPLKGTPQKPTLVRPDAQKLN